MKPEELRKHLKRVCIAGAFFALALVFHALKWRQVMVVYALAVAAVTVIAVLLQSGRGGGLAPLGGMGAESLLGTRSASPISKATYVMGALFIFTCMLVARTPPQAPPIRPAFPARMPGAERPAPASESLPIPGTQGQGSETTPTEHQTPEGKP